MPLCGKADSAICSSTAVTSRKRSGRVSGRDDDDDDDDACRRCGRRSPCQPILHLSEGWPCDSSHTNDLEMLLIDFEIYPSIMILACPLRSTTVAR